MIINRKEQLAYQKKIEELRNECNSVNKVLSETKSNNETIRNENSLLQKQIREQKEVLNGLNIQILDAEKLLQNRKDGYVSEVKSNQESISSLKLKETEIIRTIQKLEEEFKKKKEIENEVKRVQEEYNELLVKKNVLRDELKELQDTILQEKKDIDKERKSLNKEKIEISEQIKKVERMVVDYTEKLCKVELYAKRLQKYYNETGIRLQILKEFGIE